MLHHLLDLRLWRAGLALILAFLVFSTPIKPSVKAAGPGLVINQVYGSGGNLGAVYNADYVELYNAGPDSVDLSGWSFQYASATGSSWSVSPLSGVLDPGHYFLVAEDKGASGPEIPFVDLLPSRTLNLSSTAGKLALVSSTVALTGTCPIAGSGIIDFLGYGSGTNCFEGAGPAPALPSPVTAYAWFRQGTPPVDSQNNSSDFASGTPSPRDYYTGYDRPPYVATSLPQHGAFQVSPAVNITLTFSESVSLVTGWYALNCLNSGPHAAQVTGGMVSYQLDPEIDLGVDDLCTVHILAAQVTDQDASPGTPMKSDYRFAFSTGLPRIHQIQGAQHRSDYEGLVISGLSGVVTAVDGTGFFMQDPVPDADPATSEGIYVYTDSAPFVVIGDQVQVSGTLSEYRPDGASSLSRTEIISRLIQVGPPGNQLPAPLVLGEGGQPIPASVIEDDSNSGDVETDNVFDPANDALDFFESLEGMRVQVNDLVVIGPTTSGGEVAVLANYGVSAGLRTGRGGLLFQYSDPNPERLILGNALIGSKMPKANVGDHFAGSVTGVLDYRSSSYTLEAETAPVLIRSGLAREIAAPAGQYQLSVASFNLENLAANDSATKFNRLAGLVVNNLRSPDLLAVEEVQDNDGATNDGMVAANITFEKFISAIQAAGGPVYQYVQIDPRDIADGGVTGGNIRVALLYRTDRGLTFVPGEAGDATMANSVVTDGQGQPHLALNPGRILDTSSPVSDPTNAFFDSRKPLAGEFRYNGETLFVIANHFNSKSGDSPLFGRLQPPVRPGDAQRLKQALVVNDFVGNLLAADPQAHVIVLGDLNDYQFSPVLGTLKGESAILHDLITDLPLEEQYTYVYEGNAQALDHILLSAELYGRLIRFDSLHVNAEFYDQVSDHDPQLAILDLSHMLYLPALAIP